MPSHGQARATAWSLEHRLPILISLLLACVVGGLSLAAYREVRATAISHSTDVLQRVHRELITGAARSSAARVEALRSVAADPTVLRAVTGGRSSASTLESRLTASRESNDTTFVAWRIAGSDGQSHFVGPAGWAQTDSAILFTTLAEVARTQAEQRSPLYAVGERTHAWLAVPVLANGRVVGTVAELRRVGDNYGADAAIRALVDEDARMLFTSRGSSLWVSTRGRPVAAPFPRPSIEDHVVRVDAGGRGIYAVQSVIPTTPWLVVLYQSEASVLRRPQEFLRRMLGAGLVALALAAVCAWLLGRLVTRPLRDVTSAATALAEGDYSRRVTVRGGGREVASLASTFNAMAAATGNAHATLAERNEELQRANAAKAQFLAMMSHELRTPLNAIGGFTELLELGLRGPVTPEQVEDLGRIRRNKDLLLAIITDILDFSRTDAGVITLQHEPVAVAPVLTDVVDAVSHLVTSKGIRLDVGEIPDDAIVRGDRKKLQQVLLNLVSNAVKFTEPGGVVAVDTIVAGGAVRIDVRDTGPGISAAQLDAIFEPFVQVDASLTRRAGGTGLGLAIARQLTRAMGGTVGVRSIVGEGSTFSLTLPRLTDSGVRNVAPRHTPRETSQV